MNKYKSKALGYFCFALAFILWASLYDSLAEQFPIFVLVILSFVAMTHRFSRFEMQEMLREEQYE